MTDPLFVCRFFRALGRWRYVLLLDLARLRRDCAARWAMEAARLGDVEALKCAHEMFHRHETEVAKIEAELFAAHPTEYGIC